MVRSTQHIVSHVTVATCDFTSEVPRVKQHVALSQRIAAHVSTHKPPHAVLHVRSHMLKHMFGFTCRRTRASADMCLNM